VGIAAWVGISAMRGCGRGHPLQRGLVDLVPLGVGAVSVLGATAAIFGWLGVLPELIYQAFVWPARYYMGVAPIEQSPLVRAAAQSFKVFSTSQGPLWLAALGGVLLLKETIRTDVRVGLLVAWMAASGVSIALGGARFSQYYFVALVPPFAVCGGWALASLWRGSQPSGRVWLAAAALTLLVYAGRSQADIVLRAVNERIIASKWQTPEEAIAAALRDGRGSVFVWGNAPQVFALSGRSPASRYLQTEAVSYDFAISDQVFRNRAEVLGDLQAHPPGYIALDTPWLKEHDTLDFPELRMLLPLGYELANNPRDPIMSGWELYRHRQ
jgi:hypothetical protein